MSNLSDLKSRIFALRIICLVSVVTAGRNFLAVEHLRTVDHLQSTTAQVLPPAAVHEVGSKNTMHSLEAELQAFWDLGETLGEISGHEVEHVTTMDHSKPVTAEAPPQNEVPFSNLARRRWIILGSCYALGVLLCLGGLKLNNDSVRCNRKGCTPEDLNPETFHPAKSSKPTVSCNEAEPMPFHTSKIDEEDGGEEEELDEEVRGAMAAALAECEQLRRLLAEMKIRSSMAGTSDDWLSSNKRSPGEEGTMDNLQEDLAQILKHSELEQSMVTKNVEDGEHDTDDSPEKRLAENLKCKQLIRLLKQCRKLRRKVAECAVRASYIKVVAALAD